ncbi:hypothetical protein E3N88_05383 [Mikania micrantha]|uniref:Uncharacterized protein n=1 Tax=Mikania micrantha TaxID=192012 RepID=A0A5N6PMZ8_9ASTR|nr:hypothetical protein E3N88_05383 [Mikania micrantha]
MYSTIWSPSVSTCKVAGGTVASLQLRSVCRSFCFITGFVVRQRWGLLFWVSIEGEVVRFDLQHTKFCLLPSQLAGGTVASLQLRSVCRSFCFIAGVVVRQRWGLFFWVSIGGLCHIMEKSMKEAVGGVTVASIQLRSVCRSFCFTAGVVVTGEAVLGAGFLGLHGSHSLCTWKSSAKLSLFTPATGNATIKLVGALLRFVGPGNKGASGSSLILIMMVAVLVPETGRKETGQKIAHINANGLVFQQMSYMEYMMHPSIGPMNPSARLVGEYHDIHLTYEIAHIHANGLVFQEMSYMENMMHPSIGSMNPSAIYLTYEARRMWGHYWACCYELWANMAGHLGLMVSNDYCCGPHGRMSAVECLGGCGSSNEGKA